MDQTLSSLSSIRNPAEYYSEVFQTVTGTTPVKVTDVADTYKCPLAPWTHAKGTDNNPSSVLYKQYGYFKCFSCDTSLPLDKFIVEYCSHAKIPYKNLRDTLRSFKIKSSTDRPSFNAKYQEIFLHKELENVFYTIDELQSSGKFGEALDYLRGRGISLDTAKKLEIQYDAYRQRVVFPVRCRQGRLHGYTGRAIFDVPEYPKILDYKLQKAGVLLGMHLVDISKPVLLVEGLFGYAHLHEIGADQYFTILCLMGCILTSHKLRLILDLAQPVYILTDNDDAGRKFIFSGQKSKKKSAADLIAENLTVFIPIWPEGKTDPDELTIQEVTQFLTTSPIYEYKADHHETRRNKKIQSNP